MKTCLLVTHAIEFLQYADRVIVINGGKIEAAGHLTDLQQNSHLREVLEIIKINQHNESRTIKIGESLSSSPSNQQQTLQGITTFTEPNDTVSQCNFQAEDLKADEANENEDTQNLWGNFWTDKYKISQEDLNGGLISS